MKIPNYLSYEEAKKLESVYDNSLNKYALRNKAIIHIYNLEFMLNTNGESITNKEKDKKLMMLKFTYEQVLATQAEQVNGKANNMDNVSDFGKLLLKDTEMINFADEKKFKAM